MKKRVPVLLLVAAFFVGVAASADATSSQASSQGSTEATSNQALSQETRTEVVEGIVELLDERYVIPETAQRLAAMLKENLSSGAYGDEDSHSHWAATLTRDLQAISGDKHLRVSYGENSAQGRSQGPVRVRRMPGSGSSGSSGGSSGGGVFKGVRGIPEAKVLPGNIGYVDIRLFVPRGQEEELAIAAMETVADVEALIFDLRTCAGGSPDMVHFITSYLYSPEPVHLLTYHYARQPPKPAYTLAKIPGQRMPEVPVYLVTSRLTGSGCEEFSYVLKHHGRATLIGEVTGGAGHGGGVHPVAAGFSVFMPNFRPVHPVTGGGWEGVGVKPTVESSVETALPLAQKMALEGILEGESDSERKLELRALIANLETQIVKAAEPVEVDTDTLAEYVGEYEIRTITLGNEGLYLQRVGGPKLLMSSGNEPDTFSLKRIPQARIRFGRDQAGAIVELHVLAMNGNWEVSKR